MFSFNHGFFIHLTFINLLNLFFMKKLQQLIRILPILIGVLFVTSITSCSSDDNPSDTPTIVGQWKLDNMNVTQEGTLATLPYKIETTGTSEDYYLTFNEDHTFDVTGSITYILKSYVNNSLINTVENTVNYTNITFEDNTWEIVNSNELHSGYELVTNDPNITVISNNTVTTITTLTNTELVVTLSGEIITLDNTTNTETTMSVSGEAHYTRN